ncbi:MAG TPA: hypothetical protein VIJ99_01740 [Acidimicrobiales bacterium]
MTDEAEPTDTESESESTAHHTDPFGEKIQDLRGRLKNLTQPLVDSLDSRLRDQVDRRVDEKIDDRVQQLVDEALTARLAVIERAIADIDRGLKELQEPKSD